MKKGFIPPYGGYRELLSYQRAEVVYDATVRFCQRHLDRRDRTVDQMVQAARSGKQNIAEASAASGTSKKMKIKLTNVARASLKELLEDYRKVAHCLLGLQMKELEQDFIEEGGLRERMTRARLRRRREQGTEGT